MEIRERVQANILILRPVGRVDSQNGAELQARLLGAVGAGARHCILDLGALEFISTAGLRAILTAVRAKPAATHFALAAASEVVAEILKIARFIHIVPIYATVGEAAAALLLPAPGPPPAGSARSVPLPPSAAPAATLSVRFWGARGGLPVALEAPALRAKIHAAVVSALVHNPETPEEIDAFIEGVLPFPVRGTFAGNSSCVGITAGDGDHLLCDLGSGARAFGRDILAGPGRSRARCHVLLSDLHLDHVIGYPFLALPGVAGHQIRLYGCHQGGEEALRRRLGFLFGPDHAGAAAADVDLVALEPGRTDVIAGFDVTPFKPSPASDACGYRISGAGKTIVYSAARGRHYLEPEAGAATLEFYRGAEMLILAAAGHAADRLSAMADGSQIAAVDLASAARASRLVLFDFDADHDDAAIEHALAEAIRYQAVARLHHPGEILAAHDGLQLQV